MEQKRIYLFDNVKFVLITLVVIGHFIDYSRLAFIDGSFKSVFIFIYTFHMPAFIFISGLFYKSRDIASKFAAYLSIGMLMKIILYFTALIRNGTAVMNLVNIGGVSWYMFAVAAFTVLTYALRNVDRKFLLVMAVIVACFAGYCDEIGDKFAVSRIIAFYPFYLAGTMTDSKRLVELAEKKRIKALSAAVITVWAVLCIACTKTVFIIKPLVTGRNPFSVLQGGCAPYGGALRLLCYAVSGVLVFSVICLMPSKKIPVISTLGTKTLQIYFWHVPIIYFLTDIPFIKYLIATGTATRWAFVLLGIPLTFILALKPFEYPSTLVLKYTKKKRIDKE